MKDNQQKSIPKPNELETSPELKALAKALMVNVAWKMAGLLEEEKSDPQSPQPPYTKH